MADALQEYVVSLIKPEGTTGTTAVEDLAGPEWTFRSTAQIVESATRFPDGALRFDGAEGGGLDTDTEMDFSASDFCIEVFHEPVTRAGTIPNNFDTIFSKSETGGSDQWGFLYAAAIGHPYSIYWRNSAGQELVTPINSGMVVGQRYHLAFVKEGAAYRIYKDGALLTSGTGNSINTNNNLRLFRWCSYRGVEHSSNALQGESRITLGHHRYDTAFTAPTSFEWTPPSSGAFGTITGTVKIDGVAAQRQLIGISYAPQEFEGEETPRRIVVGETTSAEDGTYTLETPGFIDEVIVLALDNYGEIWRPNRAYLVGQRIRPTRGNETGYGYDITIAGDSGSTEPEWWVPAGGSDTGSIGAATAVARPLWWSVAHAPILPTAIEPEEPDPGP